MKPQTFDASASILRQVQRMCLLQGYDKPQVKKDFCEEWKSLLPALKEEGLLDSTGMLAGGLSIEWDDRQHTVWVRSDWSSHHPEDWVRCVTILSTAPRTR